MISLISPRVTEEFGAMSRRVVQVKRVAEDLGALSRKLAQVKRVTEELGALSRRLVLVKKKTEQLGGGEYSYFQRSFARTDWTLESQF